MTPRQERFVAEYLVDLNAKQAAIRAGYSPKSATAVGSRLLTFANVSAAIEAGRKAQMERAEMTADMVINELRRLAFGDARKLVEYRRTCCRYCWGKANKYHHTKRELAEAEEEHRRKQRIQVVKGIDPAKGEEPLGKFDPQGGAGWDPRKDPNPECPECFGEGRENIRLADTRKFDADAVALYAGIEQTKDGIRVRLHEKGAALTLLARHFGVLEAPPKKPNPEDDVGFVDGPAPT